MTFYQELQLSSVGSKQLIHSTTDKKEKRRHILIYNFKVYLVMAFCVAVVTLYSMLAGNENSVEGVTVYWRFWFCVRRILESGRRMACFPSWGYLRFSWRGLDWQMFYRHLATLRST